MRVVTLLQDRLPLDPDRRLKVPAIRPEDDMVAVRRPSHTRHPG